MEKDMALCVLERSASVADVVEALRRDGAVAVAEVAEPGLVDTIRAELRPNLVASGLASTSDFNGYKTLRNSQGPLTAAPGAAALIDHDMVVKVANAVLLSHCLTYRISSITAIEVLPGELDQPLHRDDTVWPIESPGMELGIGVMWALDDFTEENGATRVVLGSNRCMRSWHLPNLSNWESATMPKGSVLFYMGSTWHGAGANRSNASRMGLITTYALGWLRQESNQYLYYPPDVAAQFGPRLRALLGYTPHGTGDDRAGTFRGECPGWLDKAPEPEWQGGQVGTAADARSQSGV
jgi:ectoine hydroxylase-related dioxygenase (phytanoyl-CoA dioxygenase family)